MTLLSKKLQSSSQEDLFLSGLENFLNEKKAKDVLLLNVQHSSQHFTHLFIATALSTLHLKSLAEACIDFVRSSEGDVLSFNTKEFDTGWAIIDFGDLILHLFLENLRKKYNLEELYYPPRGLTKDHKP